MSCKIVIPSYKRESNVRTVEVVNDAIICVSESEVGKYKEFNPRNEIVAHPDSIKGLIPKRNWMLNHFKDLFMLDDDISSFCTFYHEIGESMQIKDKAYVNQKIYELNELAKLMNIPLYGFARQSNPVAFKESKWFTLEKTITGCSYGAIKPAEGMPKLYWNEELTLKEDFWISCLTKYHYRKILVDNRFFFTQEDTFVNSGGLAEFRNNLTEMNNILELKRTFGEVIQLKKKGVNVNSKLKNNISCSFPF